MSIEAKLTELGLTLPEAPAAVAAYQPWIRTSNLVFTSGQLPFRDGAIVYAGKLGGELTEEDGYQAARQCALNAIAQLKARVHVLNVDGGTDYRLRSLTQMALYHHPDDAHADERLSASFEALAPEPGTAKGMITPNDRDLPVERMADGVIWFSFAILCEGPRSVSDYLELAQTHHTVLVSHVPALGVDGEDPARRFVHLVDAFYDRNVKLVISAAAPIASLYQGQKLRFEFERTCSRLLEMQSEEYLARPHLP